MKDKKITIALFFIILLAGMVLTFFLPKEDFSASENEYLQEFPKVTWTGIRDKSFMKDLEQLAADRFPFRSGWIRFHTRLELAAGKKEVNGVFIRKDRLAEKFDTISKDSMQRSMDAMEDFAARFSGTSSLMLIPTASDIYGDRLPAGAPGISQKALISKVYDGMDGLSAIDCYTSLASNSEKDIYYRSDHRWTSLGAYLGYSASSRQLGFTPVPVNRLNVEHASHDFLGSLYSRVIYDRFPPDTVDIYTFGETSQVKKVRIFDGTEWTERNDIYFREFLDEKDKYSVFLGQNQPIVTVETDVRGGSSLLVFKDSYANALLPFLALHYSKITLVDLRYLDSSFEDYINLNQYGQALFCYNLKNFAQQDEIYKVNLPKKEK